MKKIILASKSPRRFELLRSLGLDFKVYSPLTEEKISETISPESHAMALSYEKAYSVGKKIPDSIIIGADTIVEFSGKILGKPKDREEARRYMEMLSGKTHRVITGYSILDINQNIKIVDFEESFVEFKILEDNDITEYILTDEPYDKAGGYAIQGLANKFVKGYSGQYDNIVGLPLESIKKYLINLGVINV